jgi:hypothetical protein
MSWAAYNKHRARNRASNLYTGFNRAGDPIASCLARTAKEAIDIMRKSGHKVTKAKAY